MESMDEDRPKGMRVTRRLNPCRLHRRSIRVPGYDYRNEGSYFVTICTHQRACLFGRVIDGAMRTNNLGAIADEEWWRSAAVRTHVALRPHEFIVMPNHIHGIVRIVRAGGQGVDDRATAQASGTRGARRLVTPSSWSVPPESLGAVLRSYKSTVTRRINALRASPGEPVWQRNFYEHVVRDEAELERIVAYIASNPRRWGSVDGSPGVRRCRHGG